jgi:deoxyadenosine/deoxycytidine kinase
LGTLVAVVGNTGVGKTTLAQAICKQEGFVCAAEMHERTPFQEKFSKDHQRYALKNQFDFMLRRADQELSIRRSNFTGVTDGGLDQDFHVFTRLFYQKGYLEAAEYDLCARLYRTLRTCLAEPELYVWLKAPFDVVAQRFEKRQRRLNIAQEEDMQAIEILLHTWLEDLPEGKLVVIDCESEERGYPESVRRITRLLNE